MHENQQPFLFSITCNISQVHFFLLSMCSKAESPKYRNENQESENIFEKPTVYEEMLRYSLAFTYVKSVAKCFEICSGLETLLG